MHARRPAIGLALAAVAGTLLGLRAPDSFPAWVAAAGVATCGAAAFWLAAARSHRDGATSGGLILAIALAAAAHAAHREAEVQPLLARGRNVELVGCVRNDPERESLPGRPLERWSFHMRPETLTVDGQPIAPPRTVAVRWVAPRGGRTPEYGDRWLVRGRTGRRRGADALIEAKWSASTFQAREQGHPFVARCYAVRAAAAAQLAAGVETFTTPLAVVRSLLLGYRGDLPPELLTRFRKTGAFHIFAISGLHVGVLCGLLLFGLSAMGLPRTQWVLALGPLLLAYTLATGMRPSALRACVMAVVFFAGPLFGRRPDSLSAWAAALTLLLVLQPLQALDLGFLFSFVVVLGLILLFPLFERPLGRRLRVDPTAPSPGRLRVASCHAGRAVNALAAASLAAWLASAPLTAWYFGLVSPAALPGNLLVIPLTFLLVTAGALSLATAPLLPAVAVLFNHAAILLAEMLTGSVGLLAELPGAHGPVTDLPGWTLALWYGALLALRATVPSAPATLAASPETG